MSRIEGFGPGSFFRLWLSRADFLRNGWYNVSVLIRAVFTFVCNRKCSDLLLLLWYILVPNISDPVLPLLSFVLLLFCRQGVGFESMLIFDHRRIQDRGDDPNSRPLGREGAPFSPGVPFLKVIYQRGAKLINILGRQDSHPVGGGVWGWEVTFEGLPEHLLGAPGAQLGRSGSVSPCPWIRLGLWGQREDFPGSEIDIPEFPYVLHIQGCEWFIGVLLGSSVVCGLKYAFRWQEFVTVHRRRVENKVKYRLTPNPDCGMHDSSWLVPGVVVLSSLHWALFFFSGFSHKTAMSLTSPCLSSCTMLSTNLTHRSGWIFPVFWMALVNTFRVCSTC